MAKKFYLDLTTKETAMAPTEFKTTNSLITAIFERYRYQMNRIAYGILKDAHSADDAVQESMIKIIRNIHMIDDIDSRKCANYIYIIVKHTSLDLYRKKRSEQEKTVTEDAFDFVNIVDEKTNLAVFDDPYGFSDEMEEFLSLLKDTDKDIICLKYGADFTTEEISELMGLEQSAVRKRLSRARQRLVEIISERSR